MKVLNRFSVILSVLLIAGSVWAFPPVNDHWASAIEVVIGGGGGVIQGSTSEATDFSGAYPYPAMCDYRADWEFGVEGTGGDVWYVVHLDQAIPLHVQTCGPGFNSMVGIWDENMTLLAGNDDHCGQQAIACCDLPAGTYYVSVDGVNENTNGNFNLQINNSVCGGTVTEVEVPATTTLARNYPNPFNPATTITFSLSEPGAVELVVLNAIGQRVVTLVDGELPVGEFSVRFNAEDLPSGVYFSQLRTGDFVSTHKMLLVK